ncbi:MAG: hypothetical protein RXO24_07605 [Acidilobus sp.]
MAPAAYTFLLTPFSKAAPTTLFQGSTREKPLISLISLTSTGVQEGNPSWPPRSGKTFFIVIMHYHSNEALDNSI